MRCRDERYDDLPRVEHDHAIARRELGERRLCERVGLVAIAVQDDRDALTTPRRPFSRGRDDVDTHEDLPTPRRDTRVARTDADRDAAASEDGGMAGLGEALVGGQNEPDRRAPWVVRVPVDDPRRNVGAVVELDAVGGDDARAVATALLKDHGSVVREHGTAASGRERAQGEQRERRETGERGGHDLRTPSCNKRFRAASSPPKRRPRPWFDRPRSTGARCRTRRPRGGCRSRARSRGSS